MHGNWAFEVVKNDCIKLDEVSKFDKILFSPGPGLPSGSGIMGMIIQKYGTTKSILGICLGLQAIVESFGGKLINLPNVYHGIRQRIYIVDRRDVLFKDISSGFQAGLYHSWAADKNSLPACLKITALSENEIVMAVSHVDYDIKGVQFHPESYMTEHGPKIISNWLND
jgi:anthranilate synthase component 2